MTRLTLSKALNEGLRKALEHDPKVLIMGEDVGKLGGVFRVTDGLQKDFGEMRVMDTPLAESGIIGTAIGLALRGYRPVCEIQFDGFVYPAFDQIVSQLAKLRLRSRTGSRASISKTSVIGCGIFTPLGSRPSIRACPSRGKIEMARRWPRPRWRNDTCFPISL